MDNNKPLIAYIEIDTHAEIANNFWELTHNSQELLVDYYFSEKILNLLNKQPNSNIFKVSNKTLFQQLSTKPYDLVIIGTAHRFFNVFLKIAQKYPTVTIGHNLNFIESKNKDLIKNIFKKDVRFRIKLLLKEGLLYKNKFFEKTIGTFVLDKNMISEKYILFPLFFNIFNKNIVNNPLSVVIPGTVSQKRRDYQYVLQTLEKANFSLNITFLGKASGKELKWLQDFEQKNTLHKINYFTEKIPQNDFDKIMKTANLLWCPIQYETEFLGIKEIYGTTKVSGNIGDAIKYGKPAIFPEHYLKQYPFIISDNILFSKEFSLPTFLFNAFSKQKIGQKVENILKKMIVSH